MYDYTESLEPSNTAIVWNNVETLLSTDLQTFTEAICILYEQISGVSLKWANQKEDHSKAKQVEVFLIGNDERFPVIEIE